MVLRLRHLFTEELRLVRDDKNKYSVKRVQKDGLTLEVLIETDDRMAATNFYKARVETLD